MFHHTLSSAISMDDIEWAFDVSDLPPAQYLNRRKVVKNIVLFTDMEERRHSMQLKLEPIEENRAMDGENLDRFTLVSLESFRPLLRRGADREVSSPDMQPATGREITEYTVRFLRAGVTLQGIHYNFYGHSNSQLKSRSCFLYAATKEVISTKVEAMGDFTKLKTVGKKAKRIGLMFSTAQVATIVPPARCQDIPDIETSDYVFTDGCGLIAPKLAQEFARRIRIVFRDTRYTPSVFQIRYRGYKGVVSVDPRMKEDKNILLKLRASMKKFSGGDNYAFAIADYSKPYSYGHLNDETVLLLNTLGISETVLLQKQSEHFSLLSAARSDFRAAFCFLSYVNRPDLAEKVLLEGVDKIQSSIKKLVNDELAKMLNKRDEQRCRIFIRKSRLLFGICDAWGVLKPGECAVKVTMEGNGEPYALKNTEVAVIRNPCLHPGDWQKFRVVERPELSHLVDCIIFSTQGKRPAADLMSGGDLDGDQFFVCWDQDLIPSTLSQPALYPGVREPLLFKPITDDDRLVYFAKYTNSSLGQVKNIYLDWARVCGPMSPQCQELNRLFSQCVDGNRIKIPDKLRSAPKVPAGSPPFILDVLHDHATNTIQQMTSEEASWEGFDVDAMQLLLARDLMAMSEFEFIQLAHRWCSKNKVAFESLLHLFDFNVLSAEQQAWVIGQVPISKPTPVLVMNALCSSNILGRDELSYFGMDHLGVKWKCVYDSTCDRLDTFLDAVATNIEVFQRKLIVFRPEDRLSIAMYLPKKSERAQDCLIDDSARLLAFPHSQGREQQSRLALPTKTKYRMYCDENVFQLFEDKRANSWVFITRPGSKDSEYRQIPNAGDRRRQRQQAINRGEQYEACASIALDKFSRGLQRHIGRINRSKIHAAEIYVVSNRDVSSTHNLDLWADYVATTERMPLFPSEPKEYALPKLRDIITSSHSPNVISAIEKRDSSMLASLKSIDEYNSLFDLLLLTDDKEFLLQSFKYLLNNPSLLQVDNKSLMQTMLPYLSKEPLLSIAFGQKLASQNFQEAEPSALEVQILAILKGFILSSNAIGHLVINPLKSMLANLPPGQLSFGEFSQLLELFSLTIRSPELALEIILGVLEPESSRLLVGDSETVQYLVRNLSAIAIDHIEEAAATAKDKPNLLELTLSPKQRDQYGVVEASFRIDAPGGTPALSSHVRLTAASLPENVIVGNRCSIDALVVLSEKGRARFKCFHPLPSYYDKCSWLLADCGPFVTSKTTIDAVTRLGSAREECCSVSGCILGSPEPSPQIDFPGSFKWQSLERLNPSQNAAIKTSLDSALVCLWGPPGTGKTETIVEMLCALQERHKEARILVTAPTHNAVDNVMDRYIRHIRRHPLQEWQNAPNMLRVSTEVRKVAGHLRQYTCDAMAGQEIHASRKAKEQAMQAVKRSNIVFTTCIGSGIGLLRSEIFEIVIVDEASQQTEAASLVPLVKGASKVVLVGDHVQLRPTVNQSAMALDFDVSLFERLYNQEHNPGDRVISRLMLDTQYRMHPDICAFSSQEFYQKRLKTGIGGEARPLSPGEFCFPLIADDYGRAVFIECSDREMPGQKSKENKGQAELCAYICKLLISPGSPQKPADPKSIAVLTPYTRQAILVKQLLSHISSEIEVSSIDGFQGREADIVVFVTVRCNEHRDIGFLKDVRRMNVALTRARTALLVIGNRATLTQGDADPTSTATWKRLLDYLTEVKITSK